MRRAGTVVRATQGIAVVLTEGSESPDIGTVALDANLETVGEIVDVFGPIDQSYLAVSPDGKRPADLLGERLYVR